MQLKAILQGNEERGGDILLKRRQIVEITSIVIIAFLIGTLFNMNFFVKGGDGSPWDRVWTTISELRTQVDSLNSSLTALQSEKPQVMTFYDPGKLLIGDKQWHDLFGVTLNLQKETSVLIIVSTRLASLPDVGIYIRFRLNSTFTESRRHRPWGSSMGDILSIHHLWVNLTAGTYAFTLQYKIPWIWDTAEGRETRLTLMIIY